MAVEIKVCKKCSATVLTSDTICKNCGELNI